MFALLIAAATAGIPCPAAPADSLLKLRYDAFDTDAREYSWRNLLARGCTDIAVATLVAFRDANAVTMTCEQLGEINFHMGQALAMSGRDRESVPHFERSATFGGSAEWIAYVAAHLAYVRKDRAALQRALAEYEKTVKPGSMRLTVIRGFVRCIDKPYMEAAHCAM